MSRFWLRLDNAALIFPAIRRPGWSNVFRQSVTLTEPVDPLVLQQAADDLRSRFPSLYVRLRQGLFWYYLEETAKPVLVREDYAYPLTHMDFFEQRRACLRILYYENRIAVEFFHALTDGSGAMVYTRALAGRYLQLKHGIPLTPEDGLPLAGEEPDPAELEDSFLRYAGRFPMSRAEPNSCHLRGTPNPVGFRTLVTGILPTDRLLEAAHKYGASVTVFLTAVLEKCILEMQAQKVPRRFRKHVKITVPVDLRRIFPSRTLRNFALALNPGVDARLGSYSLEDLCRVITHQIAAETLPQMMAARIATNVNPQKLLPLRLAPLAVKNLVMRAIYFSVGETKGCLNLSNLGRVTVPASMQPYVKRLEFIIGIQATYSNNCSVVSYGNVTCVNMIRSIRQSELERRFFSRLVELGVPVDIETNQREA